MGHWCGWAGGAVVFLARLDCAKAVGIPTPDPHINNMKNQIISLL
jgi:hypothetical protein